MKTKKSPNKEMSATSIEKPTEDFDIIYASKPDNDTVVFTTAQMGEKWLSEAMQKYDPSNMTYSTYLKEGTASSNSVTLDELSTLADGAQSNLSNILTINAIVRKQINSNYLIGRVATAIEDNVNSEYRLSYNDFADQRNKTKTLKGTKLLINDFNKQIDIENLIRKTISGAYFEGSYIMYLRQKDNNWIIDTVPLGVGIISDYEINGRPVILINIKELETRIKKTFLKNKSNKAIFFDKVDTEIKENYPEEVYSAYKNRESYARLIVESTGVIRVGNLNRKYGLTPIFKALPSIIMLDTFDITNLVTSKAKAKKIIVQKLREKLMGEDGTKKAFEEQSYAHDNLMQAWRQPTVVVTTPVFVESIAYVEPQTETANVDLINLYQNRVLTCLGIGFLASDKSTGASVANISLNQLMLTINKISKQVERIIEDFYRVILQVNNINMEFLPSIKILDSEQMDYDLKVSLVGLLYNTMNCSHETSLGILGIDVEDEVQKRLYENENGYDQIFKARQTSYTSSGTDDKSGRPADDNSKNEDKQADDKLNKDTK